MLFFFLEFGRCRTKARSLHEHKLSKRRLYKDTVGPYEQANRSLKTKQNTRPPNHDDPQIPQPDLRFARGNSKPDKKQTRHTKGAGARTKHPQNRFAKGHSGLTTASLSKTCEQNELRTTTFKQTGKPSQLACLLRHRCAKTVHEHGATTYASLSVLSDQLVQKASMDRVVTIYQP